MQRAYRQSTRALGLVLLVLGLAMVAATLARGGGPLALGVVAGLALAALGGGRALLAGSASRPRERA